jgi:hypothetical protein
MGPISSEVLLLYMSDLESGESLRAIPSLDQSLLTVSTTNDIFTQLNQSSIYITSNYTN